MTFSPVVAPRYSVPVAQCRHGAFRSSCSRAAWPPLAARRSSQHFRCQAQATAADTVDASKEFPQSPDAAIRQAKQALNSAMKGLKGKKKGKKGNAGLAGELRLAVEIPVADSSPAAQHRLAEQLASTFPRGGGRPAVVFGSEQAAAHNSSTSAYQPLALSSAAAHFARNGVDGPVLILEATQKQAAECQDIIENHCAGGVVVVANAAWLRGTPPAGMSDFVDTFDAVYFFLPVKFGGIFGRGREAVLFKWSESSAGPKWGFYLDERGTMRRIGQSAEQPTNETMETMVHNASAADSPLTAGAKAFRKLTGKGASVQQKQ